MRDLWRRQGCYGLFAKNVRPFAVNSCAGSSLLPIRKKPSYLNAKGVFLLAILVMLALLSCAKDSHQRPTMTGERDTVAEAKELLDSISGSLKRPKEVGPTEKISNDLMSREVGSMRVDTLVGSVSVSGNEPFTRLALSIEDGRSSIFMQADTIQSKQLRKLQGRVVRVFGPKVKSGTGDYIQVKEFVIVR